VRCSVFLKSMGDFAAMNEVYGRYSSKLRQRARLWKWRGCLKMYWWRSTRLRLCKD